MNPLISIIVPTFNRAGTLGRTIDSILLQTYENYEIIIVEDGSSDGTIEILKSYTDKRIKFFFHEKNKGVTAAKNTGLDNINGEWFTILDSDDEIIPEALELMMEIPLKNDFEIDAVSCNCIDTSTGNLSGKGLDSDQYVDFQTLMTKCEGEFWGINKTKLLGNYRFNEKLRGYESTLWYRIYEKSKRYYLHKGLRIYHTTGDDRISNEFSLQIRSNNFEVLAEEIHYWNALEKYQPDVFAKNCLQGLIYLKANNKKKIASFYFNNLRKTDNYILYKTISVIAFNSHPIIIKFLIQFWKKIKK